MNTPTQISPAQLRRAKSTRFNPLSTVVDPSALTRKLDAFEARYLREAVNIWDTLEQRDDLIRTVVSKRKKAVGRQGWTVLPKQDLTPAERQEAGRHVQALEQFYQNLRCENALDAAEQGGFKLLIRQMMDAVGKRFAVHEIVWRPLSTSSPRSGPAGEVRPSTFNFQPSTMSLSATFRFVPLSFFENTRARCASWIQNLRPSASRSNLARGW